ncbi:hypothetical protein [Undibacterium terreum]|uniref:Uncharacterized protein n=1 Tax=Undibacterium terreum TaxID=1224302 RepID=A0A916UFJ7_9BURK|nr:hypothetical protein [Undibacterium terreum]GGC70590.1 hypothetical protein GCM10011396_17120 [Undibacterium terreum]
MIEIVVIVILLGLLIAVFMSSIPPKQENLPEYHFERTPKRAVAKDGTNKPANHGELRP